MNNRMGNKGSKSYNKVAENGGATNGKQSKPVKHVHYEFGGPIGAAGTMLGLPVAIVALSALCTKTYCLSATNVASIFSHLPNPSSLLSPTCIAVVFGWFFFHVLLERILPHEVILGAPLPNISPAKRLPYRISGHTQLWVTITSVVALHLLSTHGPKDSGVSWLWSWFRLSFVYEEMLGLAVGAIVLSLLLSVFVYLKSFARGAVLAAGGDTGNPVYDFFIGRELNPRIGSLDLKEFCELRPGLIGWAVINLAMAIHQYEKNGFVSPSMVLVNVFQGLYVWDALWNESAILTTMDITTDGFGYMLVFGDLAWVPFMYSLQARYLVDYDSNLPVWALVLISILNIIGYILFRGSNGQKDAFRSDPNGPTVRHLKFMETKTGRRLITSGYWGLARKINYTADWLMGVSWCMFCGFNHIIPFFYAIYFFVLLVHRAMRDDHMCQTKYGEDWKEYKKRVPCLFVPRVF